MRTSNIILLSLFLLACVSALSLAVTVRYKASHKRYSKSEVDEDQWNFRALSPFSELLIEDRDDIVVRKGNVNSISWKSAVKNAGAIYTLAGDSLLLRDTTGNVRDTITITTASLDKVRVIYADNFHLRGFKQDSLAVYWEENNSDHTTELYIDSSEIRRLRLETATTPSLFLNDSRVEELWLRVPDMHLDLDSASTLSHIQKIKSL